MRRTPTASPDLTVVNGNWGATRLSGIDGVLRSVDAALTEAFEATPDDSILVSTWSVNYPRTLNGVRPYKVFLTARDTHWSHYAYQFAHELCHILTGFDRYKHHKHRWFEESPCELASLFALHRIAETWLENPPGCGRLGGGVRTLAQELRGENTKKGSPFERSPPFGLVS